MFLRKQQTRFVSRLVAGLFAVQIVVTGFCLLTTQAHAMPMSGMHAAQMLDSGMADMGAHCAGSSDMDGQHKATTHSGGCFHCDEPAQYVKGATADMAPVNPVLVALSVLPEMPSLMAWDEVTTFHTPTGPPRSSSLLYTTTQRIRV